jgi:hypothetical protein
VIIILNIYIFFILYIYIIHYLSKDSEKVSRLRLGGGGIT